jgi:hypothetical protein
VRVAAMPCTRTAQHLAPLSPVPLLRLAGSTLAATAAARKRLGLYRVGTGERQSQAEDTGCGWMSRCWPFMGKGG